uniref:Reverse transcriptase domain-containing protein n=1 Tax=Amphimedon queenslandica TaxID=400682 RepID=A0A1X7SKP2_AMPQE
MSKILESIVFDKVISYIRPKLSVCQFGFLKHRSCLLQLLSSYSTVFEAVENKTPVDTVFFDFQKAFDSVPHQELLLKLWLIGITGPLWEWFREYLTGRSHCTTINSVSSDYLPVLSGVPQGSVLGPLLFLIYINDIPEKISSDVSLFADDMKFLRTIYSHYDQVSLQSDIDSLIEWCNEWKLNLNVNKCYHMSFSILHNMEEGLKYQVDSVSLNKVNTCRDLGIIVTNNLSWSKHYHFICGKAYRALHFIRRNISASSSMSVKRSLYISLVRSHLSYCSQLWSPAYIKDIRMLETVQRRAT